MRLLIISQHYPPENSGNASRVSDMAEKLVAAGAEVTVLCPHPTFPTGTFRRSWKWTNSDVRSGVRVVNLWAWQPRAKDPGFASRIAYYLTFPIHAMVWALLRPRKFDVIIGSAPPVFTGIPGLAVKLFYRRKQFVVEVRDLWIDAAVGLGFVKEGSITTRLSRRFERACYRSADLIAVTTPDVAAKIERRFPSVDTPIVVVPNGVDTTRFLPTQSPKKTQFLYAGNIGHAQDLEKVIEAIGIVRARHPTAKLVLAGAGDTTAKLVAFTKGRGLQDAVEFAGVVSRDRVPGLYAESIAGLAPLRDIPTLEYAVPTKAYEALGCGVPFLGTGIGEIRRLAKESGGGIIAENDSTAIADAMIWLIEHPSEASEMARIGREYVVKNYDRKNIATRYLESLTKTWNGAS